MKLKFVTLTGADNRTDAKALNDLSVEFPFAEWAILFSQSKEGVSRYPSYDWVLEALPKLSDANLSAHLCGKWVEDALKLGVVSFLGDEDVAPYFNRIQLNMARERLQKALKWETRLWDCDFMEHQIILGGPYQKYNIHIPADKFMQVGVAPLFDCSGGRGILAADWPKPPVHEYGGAIFCGYAGGLGPDNIEEELGRIEAVVGDAEIWVDMESRLRNDKDEFDLEKCRRVLTIARRWADN